MPPGTPVSRHCILVLRDGRVVIDWGSRQYQDVLSGEFLTCSEGEVSHTVQDEDLEPLRRSGLVADFDASQVYLHALPERPRDTLQ